MWTKLERTLARTIIVILDSDTGISERAYRNVQSMLKALNKSEFAQKVMNAVEATDGSFYISHESAKALRMELATHIMGEAEIEVINALREIAPKSVVDYDNEGQMIVYTGIRSKYFAEQ